MQKIETNQPIYQWPAKLPIKYQLRNNNTWNKKINYIKLTDIVQNICRPSISGDERHHVTGAESEKIFQKCLLKFRVCYSHFHHDYNVSGWIPRFFPRWHLWLHAKFPHNDPDKIVIFDNFEKISRKLMCTFWGLIWWQKFICRADGHLRFAAVSKRSRDFFRNGEYDFDDKVMLVT